MDCKGVEENGAICGKPTMYKSDFCKKHQSQDPSLHFCMGKYASGKNCSRRAVAGELFCRQHISQKGDIEKLQCPRGCGLLTYRLWDRSGYYYCTKCRGAMLDAKRLEAKLASNASIFNRLLEKEGEECSLKCPSCEGLMYRFKIVYVLPEGGGGVGNLGGTGGGSLVGLLVVIAVVAVVVAASESKKKSGRKGSMAIDGCKDCGVFWFDGDELRIVKSADIRGADEGEGEKPGTVANPDWKGATETNLAKTTSARITNCLHVDEKNGKNCRRVTYRGTEYCYMHQPAPF
ncbi:MAG: hypothetical protein VX493_03250 [Candidatus Thermoplasmatota archaeon]|nr:hypothetical protein [Candidatus Thermoplasmatota archaeon]